ncbi:5-formyltetrahydrofolate cyclo-ligase [Gorillibacterium sp. sgz5001074]|uniref:5-formyltetrahydrofolate cyclo-ligase n=1 Tax=Gorillibacterium sp. sgz5001074 TaxID=3446695 RepID=UPI003F678999
MAPDKSVLRRSVLKLRESLDPSERRLKSERLCGRLLSVLADHPGLAGGGGLFMYMPFGHEPDIFPVAEWCWKQGIPVIVPKTIREPRRLRLHRIQGPELLAPGTWGIPEPLAGAPEADAGDIVAVLVPGVAFDRSGGRLGYGGGYYDRFFAELRQAGRKPLKLAPAFEIQLVEEVPMEPHDERMDLIMTETGRYEPDSTGQEEQQDGGAGQPDAF